MKFTDGAWLKRDGVTIDPAREVSNTCITDTKVTLSLPVKSIKTRSDTIGAMLLTMEISSPMDNVFHFRVFRHKGNRYTAPSLFQIDRNEREIRTEETCNNVTVSSGAGVLTIDKDTFRMTLTRDGKPVTSSEPGALAFIQTEDNVFMREQLSLDIGEHVYGFGERFTPFVKNGQSIDIWNKDGGTFTEQAYKNIPFYITDKNLGVFVDHSENVSFEVASEHVSRVQFSVEGECLSYYLFAGSDMKDTLRLYRSVTGEVPALPDWSYGLWLSTSFTTDYDEDTVLSSIDGMLQRGIKLSVFHFDCFWMEGCKWCNFIWDRKVFPDPEGLISKIHGRGIKVCVWINPYIAQDSEIFDEGAESGYFLKTADGDVWQTDLWQPGMAIVDFTNGDARRWYEQKLLSLIDMGVDCFKTDFGERIPAEGVRWSDGSDPQRMHNFYTYLYNQTVFELLKRNKGEGEAVLFARSATAGSQKFPLHWGGDCRSDYSSMEQTIRGGLSLMLSGFSYWSHDIGGFEDISTPDVYKRWAAFGLLSSHSRLHGSSISKVPWNYDEEAADVLRYYTDIKYSLTEYLRGQEHPLMRPMVLEFQDDPACATLDRQYMLGDSYLIAPVFTETGEVTYYLPVGRWQDIHNGKTIELDCGRYFTETRGYKEMPIFRRLTSITEV